MFTKGFAASGNTSTVTPFTLPADVILYVPFNDAGNDPENSVVYQSDKGSTSATTISNYWKRAIGADGYSSTTSTSPVIIDTDFFESHPLGYTRCFQGGNVNGCIYGNDTSWYNGNIHEGDFNTLSVEFWFYIFNGANVGSGTYDRIFEWGDYYAHDTATNFDEMGFSGSVNLRTFLYSFFTTSVDEVAKP